VCARMPFNWPILISQARDACEVARGRGINQIHFFRAGDPALPPPPSESDSISLFRRLRDDNKLSLHPQPIMDISGAQPFIAKAEFLLRIERDGDFLPPPYGMIKDLEEHGLSAELDRFSSRYMLDWLEDNGDLLEKVDGVSLNISAPSFTDGIFMSDLYSDIRHARVPRNKLSLEITETAAIKHLNVAAEVISDFRELGVRFSLDDFGSGLCSFGYLQSLKVDEVKIDGRFIRELTQSSVNQEIVRAIHQVARATGKTTVAEFVDDPAKLTILQDIGLNYAQGWLFYKTVHPDHFRELLSGPRPLRSPHADIARSCDR
jgi:EAL domain-containing protein (putative c-di-GMP-specific phosphodiesterase class I)